MFRTIENVRTCLVGYFQQEENEPESTRCTIIYNVPVQSGEETYSNTDSVRAEQFSLADNRLSVTFELLEHGNEMSRTLNCDISYEKFRLSASESTENPITDDHCMYTADKRSGTLFVKYLSHIIGKAYSPWNFVTKLPNFFSQKYVTSRRNNAENEKISPSTSLISATAFGNFSLHSIVISDFPTAQAVKEQCPNRLRETEIQSKPASQAAATIHTAASLQQEVELDLEIIQGQEPESTTLVQRLQQNDSFSDKDYSKNCNRRTVKNRGQTETKKYQAESRRGPEQSSDVTSAESREIAQKNKDSNHWNSFVENLDADCKKASFDSCKTETSLSNAENCCPGVQVLSRRFDPFLNEKYLQSMCKQEENLVHLSLHIKKAADAKTNRCAVKTELCVALLKTVVWPSDDVRVTWLNCLESHLADWLVDSTIEIVLPTQKFTNNYDAVMIFSSKAALCVRHPELVFLYNLSQILQTTPEKLLLLKEVATAT